MYNTIFWWYRYDVNIHPYKNVPLILIGDLNINILDTSTSTTLYLDLINSHSFN